MPQRSALPRGLARPVQVIAVTGGKGGVGKTSYRSIWRSRSRRRGVRCCYSMVTWGWPMSMYCSA